MIKRQAQVSTPNASRYLKQLCKHFSHKAAAEFDDASGRVEFAFGLCLMQAKDEQLTMECETDTPEAFARMRSVLDDHLKQFAWREDIKLSWNDGREA